MSGTRYDAQNDAAPLAQAPDSIGGNPSVADVAPPENIPFRPGATAPLSAPPPAPSPAQTPADAALAANVARNTKLAANRGYQFFSGMRGTNSVEDNLARDVKLMGDREQLMHQNERLGMQLAEAKIVVSNHLFDLVDKASDLDPKDRELFVPAALSAARFAASGHGDAARAQPGSAEHNNPLGAIVDEDTIRSAMAMGGARLKALVLSSNGVLTDADIPLLRGVRGKDRLAALDQLVKSRLARAGESALVKLQATRAQRGGGLVPFSTAVAQQAGLTPLELHAFVGGKRTADEWSTAGLIPPHAEAAGATTAATKAAEDASTSGGLAIEETRGKILAQPLARGKTAADTAHALAQTITEHGKPALQSAQVVTELGKPALQSAQVVTERGKPALQAAQTRAANNPVVGVPAGGTLGSLNRETGVATRIVAPENATGPTQAQVMPPDMGPRAPAAAPGGAPLPAPPLAPGGAPLPAPPLAQGPLTSGRRPMDVSHVTATATALQTADKLDAIAASLTKLGVTGRNWGATRQWIAEKTSGVIPGSGTIAALQTDLGNALNIYDKVVGGTRGAGSVPYRAVQKVVMGDFTGANTADRLRQLAQNMRDENTTAQAALYKAGFDVPKPTDAGEWVTLPNGGRYRKPQP